MAKQNFEKAIIEILEEIVEYFHSKDILGSERVKSEKILKKIKDLKEAVRRK